MRDSRQLSVQSSILTEAHTKAHTKAQPVSYSTPARLALMAASIVMALLSITMASHLVGWGLRSPNPIRQLFSLYGGLLFISCACPRAPRAIIL
jgi:hypothetical protein